MKLYPFPAADLPDIILWFHFFPNEVLSLFQNLTTYQIFKQAKDSQRVRGCHWICKGFETSMRTIQPSLEIVVKLRLLGHFVWTTVIPRSSPWSWNCWIIAVNIFCGDYVKHQVASNTLLALLKFPTAGWFNPALGSRWLSVKLTADELSYQYRWNDRSTWILQSI